MSVKLARVIEVEIDGEPHTALEFDPSIFNNLKWVHGEMLFLEVGDDNKSLTLKSTGYIHNESGTT